MSTKYLQRRAVVASAKVFFELAVESDLLGGLGNRCCDLMSNEKIWNDRMPNDKMSNNKMSDAKMSDAKMSDAKMSGPIWSH
jgi:hypothetical protein